MTNSNALVTTTQLAAEFGITRRSLARWLVDPEMNFPKPTIINHRLYFSRADVDAWKHARMMASLAPRPSKEVPSKAA